MRRRDLLAAGGLSLSLSAGCLETLEREDAWRELVVDPPEGSYVPPKVDEMLTLGTETVDGRTVSLAATRPHSFWTVTDEERVRADVRDHHAIHLMATVRDAETGVLVPTSVTTAIRTTETLVDERNLWPMLSQRMGFHYGDNVPLEGDGRYVAAVQIEPTDATLADSFDERLETATTVDVEFEYAASEVEALERRLIDEDEGRGDPGAVEPMGGGGGHDHEDHDHGGSEHGSDESGHENHDHDDGTDEALESVADEWIGTGTSGDLEFAVGVLTDATRSGENETNGDGTDEILLAVVPRTRYNRFPVPFTSLSASVQRDGETRDVGSLGEHLDAELGHHYGATIARGALEDADELAVVVEGPPQLSRHEGYETAFFDLEGVTLEVDL
jgi:uncharacterized protein involved in high-affinity Fe2+ transport